MVTILVYGEWEFRMLRNGVVECRNQKKKLDWQERRAEDVNMLADQIYVIGQACLQIASVFPATRQDIPKGSELALPVQQDVREAI